MRVQGFGDAEDDARVPALLPPVLPRRLAEAERVVPGLQKLAAADPAVHASLGGRSALAVRRGSEAEVIRFVGFLFFLFLFGFLAVVWDFAVWCVCLVAHGKMYIFG